MTNDCFHVCFMAVRPEKICNEKESLARYDFRKEIDTRRQDIERCVKGRSWFRNERSMEKWRNDSVDICFHPRDISHTMRMDYGTDTYRFQPIQGQIEGQVCYGGYPEIPSINNVVTPLQ